MNSLAESSAWQIRPDPANPKHLPLMWHKDLITKGLSMLVTQGILLLAPRVPATSHLHSFTCKQGKCLAPGAIFTILRLRPETSPTKVVYTASLFVLHSKLTFNTTQAPGPGLLVRDCGLTLEARATYLSWSQQKGCARQALCFLPDGAHLN